MPVIRVDTTTTTTTLAPNRRQSLLAKLQGEIKGPGAPGGPVIFEIPEGTETIDVLVVWEDEDWAKSRSEERTALIRDAYTDMPERVIQALGATYDEALQQELLPYAVVSQFEHEKMRLLAFRDRADEVLRRIRTAKREQGGFDLPNGNVELRFPTREMADQAQIALLQKHCELNWRVVPEDIKTSGQ